MAVNFNINGTIVPAQTSSRPTINVAGESLPVPADRIGPFPIEQRQTSTTNTTIEVGDNNELSAPFIEIEQTASENGRQATSSAPDAPQATTEQRQIQELTGERGEVRQEQVELKEENESIEREIQNLERVERSLDRRIAQLKQARTLGGQIDVLV